jgi:hypothetical protein
MRNDGTLASLYEQWLGPLYRGAAQPLPDLPVPDVTRVAS